MSNLKNIAVAGCGYWGKNLVRNFAGLNALKLVCDANLDTLKQFQQQYGVEGVTEFVEILGREDIKAVAIATPASTHAELVIQALSAGKDVFVEKPLALTLQDAFAIKTALEKSNSILMVGHLLEYHPALVKLRSLFADGELGKLRYLYSNRLSFGKVRTEENVLWSFAPHDICAILGFVGQLPVSVRAFGNTYLGTAEDFCHINLEFNNNIGAKIFVSWLHPFKEQRLVVVGDKGTAVFDDVSRDEKLTIYEQTIDLDSSTPILKENTKKVIHIPPAEPLKSECQHFINCIASRNTPLTGIQNGIDVLSVLQSAQSSLDSGGQTIRPQENQLVYS